MFRMWFQEWKDNHMIRDLTLTDDSEDTRTHKVFRLLRQACNEFDLSNPIWLDKNVSDFKRNAKTKFDRDSFVEEIPFDHLQIQILEEDT